MADVWSEGCGGGEQDEAAGSCAADLVGAVEAGEDERGDLLTLDELDAGAGDGSAERGGYFAAHDDGAGRESEEEQNGEG